MWGNDKKVVKLGVMSSVIISSLVCSQMSWADHDQNQSQNEQSQSYVKGVQDKFQTLRKWSRKQFEKINYKDHHGEDDSSSSSSSSSSSHSHEDKLRNAMTIEKVKLSKENALAGYWSKSVSCGALFEGTHAGNEVYIRAEGSGGDGKYTHTLVYTYGDSYQLKPKEVGQHQVSRSKDGVFKVKLPLLKDNVPFAQQTFYLITKDKKGASVTTSQVVRVSRPVILSVATDPTTTHLNCYQRYEPYESSVGVLSNGSTDSSHIEIRQGIERINASSQGRQLGIYLNPTVGFNGVLVSLLSLNYAYFSETSKQTTQSMDVTHKYELSPGDLYQVYVQPTRYVTAYDTTLVKPCGETEKLLGAYLFQWWGYAYHVYPVDPMDKERPLMGVVGAPTENTCSSEHEFIEEKSQAPKIHQFPGSSNQLGRL